MGISGLGPLLVKEGLLSEQDRMIIAKSSGSQSWAFAKGVIASGLLDEDELASFLAERTRFQVAPKNFIDTASTEALAALDINLICMLEVFPINVTPQSIIVAMVDPLDKGVLRQLEFFTGLRIRPVIAPLSAIYSGLRQLNHNFAPPPSDLERFFFNHAPAAFQQQRQRAPQKAVSSAASLLPKEDVIKAFRPPVVAPTENKTQTIESPSLDFAGSDDFKNLPPIDGDPHGELDELAATDDIPVNDPQLEAMPEEPELAMESEPQTKDPSDIFDDDLMATEPTVDEKIETETADTGSMNFDFDLGEGNPAPEPGIEAASAEISTDTDLTTEEDPLAFLEEENTEPPATAASPEIQEGLSEASFDLDNQEVLSELAELGTTESDGTPVMEMAPLEEGFGELSPAAMQTDQAAPVGDLVIDESFVDDTTVLDVAAENQRALQEDDTPVEEEGMTAFMEGDSSLKAEVSEDFTPSEELDEEPLVQLEEEEDAFLADAQKQNKQAENTEPQDKKRLSVDEEVDSLLTDQDREHLADKTDWVKEKTGAQVLVHPAMGDLNQSLLYLSMASTTSKAMEVTARGLMPILSRGVIYNVSQRKILPALAWEGHELKTTDLNTFQTPKLTQILSSLNADQWQLIELKEQGFMFWQDNEHKLVAVRFGDLKDGLFVIGHFKQSCFLVEGFQQTTLNLCRGLWNRMENGMDEKERMVVD